MVCVAGLPHAVADEVRTRSPAVFTEDKGNLPIVRSVAPPFCYRDGMSEAYLTELAKRFEALSPRDDVTVLLAYVAYHSDATLRFVERFFPFALTAPLDPFFPDLLPKHKRRQALRAYVNRIGAVVRALRDTARVVRDVLSGQNFTPLLLPLRNFKSDLLVRRMEMLYCDLGTMGDPRAALQEAKKALLERHPLQRCRSEASHTPFFQDDRALCFKSPGRNRHGMARLLAKGHQPACLIGSRVRLGGPYDALFHYDCDNARGGVDCRYPNCHGDEVKPAARTHVNIAPNDAIR